MVFIDLGADSLNIRSCWSWVESTLNDGILFMESGADHLNIGSFSGTGRSWVESTLVITWFLDSGADCLNIRSCWSWVKSTLNNSIMFMDSGADHKCWFFFRYE